MHFHSSRDIEVGEEITIEYSEDFDGGYHRKHLTADITAGFPVTMCRCGARFCVGEISRRALKGLFDEETVAFLEIDHNNMITIDRHLIAQVNTGKQDLSTIRNQQGRSMAEKMQECIKVYQDIAMVY